MKRFVIVVCCFAMMFAAGVSACDLCSVYTATEARESRPGLFAGVSEQFSHFATLREDGEEVPNEVDQYLDSLITQLILGYQFNHRFGVQLNVPLIHRQFRRPHGDEIDSGRESGLGDVTLLGRVRVFERITVDSMVVASVVAGVKFPTGNTRRLLEEVNEHHHDGPESGIHGHDLALGSGSYDVIVGGDIFGHWKRLFATANVQYAIRTEGDFGYRFGNDLTWSAGPGVYLWLGHEGTLGVQAQTAGEWKVKDTLAGTELDDTGITAVYLGPAIVATWRDRLAAQVALDLPVMQETTDLQIVPDYRVRAGMTWRF